MKCTVHDKLYKKHTLYITVTASYAQHFFMSAYKTLYFMHKPVKLS